MPVGCREIVAGQAQGLESGRWVGVGADGWERVAGKAWMLKGQPSG